MTNSIKRNDGQVHQGDIYSDIDYIEYAEVIDGRVEISKIRYQYVMVLSQECDLTQDFTERQKEAGMSITHDKLLQSVIVVPMFNYEQFRTGSHLSNLGYSMATDYTNPNKTPAKTLKQNNNPRYHYLDFDESIPIVPSVMDFKRFFTIDINTLYRIRNDRYVCSVDTLFRERASQRFANFLSRIGLPDGR
ncbi:MAG: hypothetical protein IJN67_08070 [Oscillospiraceae bacterium]|nr:hypothetical protein [Oscillospiraceae bacterium]